MDTNKLTNPAWSEYDGQRLVLDPERTQQDMREAAGEIERLRAALKPFAEAAREWDGEPEALTVELAAYDDRPSPCVSVADFRRAAEAFARADNAVRRSDGD